MDPVRFLGRIDWVATALLAIVLLGAYVAVAILRLRRLKRVPAPQPAAPAPDLGTREFMRAVEQELEQMRGELAALREQMAALKAAREMAPQYGEAMNLASRGVDAQQIAQQCAISVAEAELVRALSQRIIKGGNQDD